MTTNVNVKWIKGMAFNAEVGGHQVILDALPASGGEDKGPKPKALVLGSLGGCTGMDVVSILAKMKVDLESFEMQIEGEETEEHPKVYRTIHITYIFKGKELPLDRLEKAVNLSQEKYCGVSAMLRGASEIKHTIRVIE